MNAASHSQFDQLVFAGGGTRCFWQGGFLNVLRDPIALSPLRVAGVSGGALSGAAFIAQKGHRLLYLMQEAFSEQDSNLDLHAVDERDGLTPHQRIYREVVNGFLDREAQEAIADGPCFQVLLAHPRNDRASRMNGLLPGLAYQAELHLVSRPHFRWAEAMGVGSTLVDARQAARDGRIVELICAAATIPPLFDPPKWDGRPVIDAGMIDQAPMPEPDEGRTLILLTRNYRHIPDTEGRRYVWPDDDTAADKIDFTDPQKIARAWEQGEAKARRLLPTFI